MASILQVEQIKGPTSGASANKITVDSDQTLAIDGTIGGTASIPAARLSGTLPAIDGSSLTDITQNSGACFEVKMTSTQTLTHNTNTTLPFNSESFDLENQFNTSNYRFKPEVAGYYQINLNMKYLITDGREYYIATMIYKNGGQIKSAINSIVASAGQNHNVNLSALIYLNTTDYIEARSYHYDYSNYTTIDASYDNLTSYFSGHLVRKA